MQFPHGLFDSCTAVNVNRSAKPLGDFTQRDAFTIDFARAAGLFLFPCIVRREGGGIYVCQVLSGLGGATHFTLTMTRVRSSESGAFCVNQSTSRRMTSASSAEFFS